VIDVKRRRRRIRKAEEKVRDSACGYDINFGTITSLPRSSTTTTTTTATIASTTEKATA